MRRTYTSNTELWAIEKELKENGYKKVADCYWAQIFEKDGEQIILERE